MEDAHFLEFASGRKFSPREDSLVISMSVLREDGYSCRHT